MMAQQTSPTGGTRSDCADAANKSFSLKRLRYKRKSSKKDQMDAQLRMQQNSRSSSRGSLRKLKLRGPKLGAQIAKRTRLQKEFDEATRAV
jgi:hypothetical protein